MHEVVDIDYADTGGETVVTMYRAEHARDCWNFVKSRLLHPSKLVRSQAKKYFVRDGRGAMVHRMPHDVKSLLDL